MLFNSLHYLIFFPIVVTLYFLTPDRYRWILLLAASYYFYMAWKPVYILLIIFSTVVDYILSRMMGQTDDQRKRKRYLRMSLFINLSLLFLFKYFNFFNDSLKVLFGYFNINYSLPAFKLLLPMGISFYTFQTLSYTIDVYRGDIEPEKHFGIFALYVTFFPQLVAGPIERSSNLLPQFREKHRFDYERITDGLKLMAWGMFKKVVIADRIAILVNTVYNDLHSYTGFPLILATLAFAFQIFCDFSGYSDIAIGSAQVMGFRLMENFRRPYLAKSISEFWRRWHISLSTWLKDYVYIPLGGNRVVKWRRYYNLFLTFFISGLWHGASWTFVVWGMIHGFYQIFSIATKKYREKFVSFIKLDRFPRLYSLIQRTITFLLVLFGWIFFRANTIADANYVIRNMFKGDFTNLLVQAESLGLSRFLLIISVISILVMELVHIYQETKGSLRDGLKKRNIVFRWSLYIILVVWIIIFGNFGSQEFIYFQF